MSGGHLSACCKQYQGPAAETVPEHIACQDGALQQRFQMIKLSEQNISTGGIACSATPHTHTVRIADDLVALASSSLHQSSQYILCHFFPEQQAAQQSGLPRDGLPHRKQFTYHLGSGNFNP